MSQEVIESLKKNFINPTNAKIFIEINKSFPFVFSIDTEKKSENLIDSLELILKTQFHKVDILQNLEYIKKDFFDSSRKNSYLENSSYNLKEEIKKIINNVDNVIYWEDLLVDINQNNITQYVDKKERKTLNKIACDIKKKYKFKSIGFNINHEPYEFLNDLNDGLEDFCNIFDFPKHIIGLDIINLNFKNQKMEYSGLAHKEHNNNIENFNEPPYWTHISLNKLSAFAHEWFHVIDSGLGHDNVFVSQLIDGDITINKDLSKFNEFKKIIHSVDFVQDTYNKDRLKKSLKSIGKDLVNYAKNKNSFNKNFDIIIDKFINNISDSKTEVLKHFKEDLEQLLNQSNHMLKILELTMGQAEFGMDKLKPKIINNDLMLAFESKGFKISLKQKEVFESKTDKTIEQNSYMSFAKDLEKLIRLKNYAGTTIEMIARSFEAFVAEEFQKKEKLNPLVEFEYNNDLYPQGSVKEKLNYFWSKNIGTIKHLLENKSSQELNFNKFKIR